jgi:hypothetical protein
MKKSMSGVVALLAGAFAVHCQGVVSFCNYLVLSPYIYISLGSTLLGGSSTVTTGGPEMDVGNGNDWTVALYGNAGGNNAASNLVQLETEGGQPVMANLETGNLDDADPGSWVYGADTDAIVPGTSAAGGSLVTVQIRAWYSRGGQYTTYEAAFSANLPVGVSALANMVDEGQGAEGAPQPAPGLPSGTGPGELGNIILSYPPVVSQSGPVLTVTVNADPSGALEPNSIILTWPTTNGGFTLQSTTNLGSPMVWTNVSIAPVVVNGQNKLTNIISGGQQFFRLANP